MPPKKKQVSSSKKNGKPTKANSSPCTSTPDDAANLRWNGESSEGRILVGILTNPATQHMTAAEIQVMWTDFQKYSKINFAKTVSRLKKNMTMRGDKDFPPRAGDPIARCTVAGYEDEEDDDEDEDYDDFFVNDSDVSQLSSNFSGMNFSGSKGSSVTYYKNEISCMHLMAPWCDKHLVDRVTIEIMPPYLSFDQYNFFLGPTGRTIEGNFVMPKLWTDVSSRNNRFHVCPVTKEGLYNDVHPRTIAQKKTTEEWMGNMYGTLNGFKIKMISIHLPFKARFVITSQRQRNFSVKYCTNLNANVVVIELEDDSKPTKMSGYGSTNDVDVDEIASTFGSTKQRVTPSVFGGQSVVSLTGTKFAAARKSSSNGIPEEVDLMSIYEEETVEDDDDDDLSGDDDDDDDGIVPPARRSTLQPTHPYFRDDYDVSRSTHLKYEHDFNLEIEKQKFLNIALNNFEAQQQIMQNSNTGNNFFNSMLLNENHANLLNQWNQQNTTPSTNTNIFGTPNRCATPNFVSNTATPNGDLLGTLNHQYYFSPQLTNNKVDSLVDNGGSSLTTTTPLLPSEVVNKTKTLPTEVTNPATTVPTEVNNAFSVPDSHQATAAVNDTTPTPEYDELNFAIESMEAKKKAQKALIQSVVDKKKELAHAVADQVRGKKRLASEKTQAKLVAGDQKTVASTGSYNTMATKRVVKKPVVRRSSRSSKSGQEK